MSHNTAINQQCPLCGRIIFGVGPLVRHMKVCKRKMCTTCERRETCPAKLWTQLCPIVGDKWGH